MNTYTFQRNPYWWEALEYIQPVTVHEHTATLAGKLLSSMVPDSSAYRLLTEDIHS